MSSVSAISAPVIRNRLSAAITSTRRLGAVRHHPGAEERSSSPSRPSARWRAIHLRAVRSLTPAASAAALSDHPHAIDQQLAALQTEPGVSVQLHPVSSLGLMA